jgi:hypothetical protein
MNRLDVNDGCNWRMGDGEFWIGDWGLTGTGTGYADETSALLDGEWN